MNDRKQSRPWGLWRRQALAVCRFELKKTFIGRRSWPIYILGALPVMALSFRLLPFFREEVLKDGTGFMTMLFAAIFQTFILKFVVYFGCVAVFMNLFRGEMLDRSLHYYLLCPIRREVLVAGKYLAGLLTTTLVFGASTAASFMLLYLPLGWSGMRELFVHGHALWQLAAYLAVVALACAGYGAVFLVAGLLVRNPVIPAVVILVWENIIFLLPPLLKKISVAYYLLSLCPVQLPQGGPIEILAEPSPPLIAIPGLVGVTILLMILAALRIRHMEITYASE